MGFETVDPNRPYQRFRDSFDSGKKVKFGAQDQIASHLAGRYQLHVHASKDGSVQADLCHHLTRKIHDGSRGGTTNTIPQLKARIAASAGYKGDSIGAFLSTRDHFSFERDHDVGDSFMLTNIKDIGCFLKTITHPKQGINHKVIIELNIDPDLMVAKDAERMPLFAADMEQEDLQNGDRQKLIATDDLTKALKILGIKPMDQKRKPKKDPNNLLDRESVRIVPYDGRAPATDLLDEWLNEQTKARNKIGSSGVNTNGNGKTR